MTTTGTGRAGDPTAQVPEGLRKLIADALTEPCQTCSATGRIVGDAGELPCVDCLGEGRVYLPEGDMADAVLAALFAACEVREHPHMWLVDHTRTGRRLILAYPLPDEPIPPMPEGLAEMIRKRIGELPPVPVIPDDEMEEQ